MSILHGENVFFPLFLRFTVNADRICRIAFEIRLALLAVKNVIGAEVNQLRFFLAANLREVSRRFRVDLKRLSFLFFAKINMGKRGRIDQNVELEIVDLRMNLFGIGEIELRVIETDDVEFAGEIAHKRSAAPPAGSNDDNFHSSVAALYERRIIFRRSSAFAKAAAR